QQQARIFKEFRQLDPSAGGVGLGLYIAQSILRSMGAELNLDSSIGQGATFSFEIRVAAVDDEVIDWTAPTSLPGRTSARLQSAKPDPVPPAHERSKLAILAQGGHLTDIERWLQVAL